MHPLRVETVAWFSAQKDLWSGLFALLALVAYVRSLRTEQGSAWSFRSLSLGAFCVSVLCKGTSLVLPVWLVIVDRVLGRPVDRRCLLDKLPYAAVSAAAGVAAIWARHSYQEMLEEVASPMESLVTGVYRLGGTFLFRTGVPGTSRFPVVPPAMEDGYPLELWMACAVAVGVVLLGVLFRRRARIEVLGLIWFVAGLSPSLHLQNLGYAADRFTYLPSVGISLLLGALAQRWCAREARTSVRSVGVAVAASAMLFLAVTTFQQAREWRDSLTLSSSLIELYQANPGRNGMLATLLEIRGRTRWEQGDERGAREDYAAAAVSNPLLATDLLGTAETLMAQEKFAGAVEILDSALRLDDHSHALTRSVRSRASSSEGRRRRSIRSSGRSGSTRPMRSPTTCGG